MKREDYLNFILFSSDVTTWKDTLVQATPANLEMARAFVKNIRDQGSKGQGSTDVYPNRSLFCTSSLYLACLSLGGRPQA